MLPHSNEREICSKILSLMKSKRLWLTIVLLFFFAALFSFFSIIFLSSITDDMYQVISGNNWYSNSELTFWILFWHIFIFLSSIAGVIFSKRLSYKVVIIAIGLCTVLSCYYYIHIFLNSFIR